jgi:hypothetical protein
MEISWLDINKYAECKTQADMLAVNADYKNDVPSDGEWVYPLPNLEDIKNSSWELGGFVNSNSIVKFTMPLPKIKGLEYSFRKMQNLKTLILNTPELVTVTGILESNGSIEYLEINAPKAQIDAWWGLGEILPKLHTAKINAPETKSFSLRICKSLRVLEGTFSNISGNRNFITNSQLNKASALNFLNSLGAHGGTNTATIGIHVDNKTDEEVLAAIANAEAKGWTLTVQWNGTPTSTASTMAMGSLIYAKVGEMERPDGTTERVLDWGHYVTNPEGYETFRSLASAYRYFGLPMPEDLTNN